MAKKHFRRQVSGNTTKGDPITIGHVSSNGRAVTNARAKGCFGFSDPYRSSRKPINRNRR